MWSKKINILFLLLVMNLSFINTASAGKIYKWVDENGITQFSTYPPLVQKPEQNITTVKGLSTATTSTTISESDLQYVWFVVENGIKYTMTFTETGFAYRPQTSRTSAGLDSSGDWKLDGGMLELTYKFHKDKSRIGTKEIFFIKMPDEYSLTLIAKTGNKRFNYRRDTDLLKSDKAISRLAQGLIGFWQGVGGGDSINFSNEKFELKGKRKEMYGSNIHESYGTKYAGRWTADDPYITLEITLDEVYKLEKEPSKVGQEWRWVIVKHNADALTVRDSRTRRLKRFVKTSRNK